MAPTVALTCDEILAFRPVVPAEYGSTVSRCIVTGSVLNLKKCTCSTTRPRAPTRHPGAGGSRARKERRSAFNE